MDKPQFGENIDYDFHKMLNEPPCLKTFYYGDNWVAYKRNVPEYVDEFLRHMFILTSKVGDFSDSVGPLTMTRVRIQDHNKAVGDEAVRQLIYGLPPSEGLPDCRPNYPRYEPRLPWHRRLLRWLERMWRWVK